MVSARQSIMAWYWRLSRPAEPKQTMVPPLRGPLLVSTKILMPLTGMYREVIMACSLPVCQMTPWAASSSIFSWE